MDSEIVTQELDEVVRLIVEVADPLRVVLFGSAARGEAGPDSNVDLMVLIPDEADRRRVADALYIEQTRRGISLPVEFLVCTPKVFDSRKDHFGFVYYDIAREGRELYRAA